MDNTSSNKKHDVGHIKSFEGEHDFLSNHYESTFFYKGVKYKSVTHAYQSLKCRYATDAALVRATKTPAEAVQKARQCAVRSNWQDVAEGVMLELLRLKFENPFLKPRLAATQGQKLGNDRNFVGKLLMEVRNELTNE